MTFSRDLLTILLISLTAGMGTSLGGLIAVLSAPRRRTFAFLMGITAGVMITLSFLELVNEAWQMAGWGTATLGFGLGAVFMLLIDFFTPHIRFGEKEVRGSEAESNVPAALQGRKEHHGLRRHHHGRAHNPQLVKSGLLIAVGIAIHNLPEGFAVGAGFALDARFGLFIALAILLHNIPEGIATALPLYMGGLSRWKAFRVSLFSGLVEPLGALLAYLFLGFFSNLIPAALAFAGGVMVFITLDELIPTAREHGHHHLTAIGIILGALFVFVLSGLLGV